MRILIIGGSGMLGYHLLTSFQAKRLEVAATLRYSQAHYESSNLDFKNYRFFDAIDVTNLSKIRHVFETYQPQVVINAIRYKAGKHYDYLNDVELTAVFPLKLSQLCETYQARLIHISTNCVFSGNKDNFYVEEDTPDATDVYGRCKAIAEDIHPSFLVLRTSIIGYEYSAPRNLVNWILSQPGDIKGFTKAYFNGLTVAEFSRILFNIIQAKQAIHGTWHLASDTISKFQIATSLTEKLGMNRTVIPDDTPKHSPLLSQAKFSNTFQYQAPSWENMLTELVEEIA